VESPDDVVGGATASAPARMHRTIPSKGHGATVLIDKIMVSKIITLCNRAYLEKMILLSLILSLRFRRSAPASLRVSCLRRAGTDRIRLEINGNECRDSNEFFTGNRFVADKNRMHEA
jgi:hypothetical protein